MRKQMSKIKTNITEYGFYLLFISILFIIGILALRVGAGLTGWIFLAMSVFLTLVLLFIIWTEWHCRIIAAKQGLKIERILHDPTFFDPQREYASDGRTSLNYRKRLLQSYCLPHRLRKTSTWALLMPEVGSKVEYPNGWRLVVKQGEVSDGFRRTIEQIANDELWKKNHAWLEIHSYPDRICAFWDEGNWKIAGSLFDMLSNLSEKTQ